LKDLNLVDKTNIQKLINYSEKSPAVTIYLPTHRSISPDHLNQDEIRLKNLLYRVEELLSGIEDGESFLGEFESQVKKMVGSKLFYEQLTEGLMICASPGFFSSLHLEIDVEEYVAVGERFYLAPILGLLNDYTEYYVLVLATHLPSLFKGDNYGLYSTNVQLPKSLKESLKIDELGKDSQQQQSSYGGAKGFNGRGGEKNIEQNDRLRFFRSIDQIMVSRLDKKLPLVLVGTEKEVSEYREISKYPNILKDHIEGSYRDPKPHELFNKSQQVINQDIIKPEHDKIIDEYNAIKGNHPHLVANELKSIYLAAKAGRIDKLILGLIHNTADNVREGTNRLPKISFPPLEVAQLYNEITRVVWNNGGKIININRLEMPTQDTFLLATLRY